MPDIPPNLPGEAALALNRLGLPTELVNSLKPGESLAARVIREIAPGRYLLNVSGSQVTAESRLTLSAGERLSLAVRESGTRLLLDLVLPTKTPARPAQASQPSAPAASGLAQEPASASAAARAVQAGTQAALARSAPLGEALSEARRALSDSPAAAGREVPSPALPAAGQSSPPASSQPQTGAPASAAPVTADTVQSAQPAATAPQTAPPAPASAPAPSAAPPPAQPVAPHQPPVAATPAALAPSELSPQIAELLRALTLALPELAGPALEAPPAAPGEAPVLPEIPAAAQLAALVGAAPERIAELLALVEARTAAVLAELPGATQLDALVAALDRLPPPPAPGTPSPQAAPAAPPPTEAAVAQQLGQLLDRLLAALSREGKPELPAELRTELESLGASERGALRELAAERERALVESSPRLAALGRAHQHLLDAGGRSALGRLGSMATSQPGATFTYVEIPTSCGPEQATARLRVMVRGDGRGGGGKDGKPSGSRPVRAVLDLSLSALGEVWTELVLSGQQLAVRLEFPDAERRDFVIPEIPALTERLAARGLEAEVSAEARKPAARGLAGELWPENLDPGRLDLWA